MGGIGSGRHWRYDSKATTSDYRAIDVRKWKRKELLKPGSSFSWQWSRGDQVLASIQVNAKTDRIILTYRYKNKASNWEKVTYPIYLNWTPCNLGGKRPWFSCPIRKCHRRVAMLYWGGIFACRHCYKLAYSSQREELHDRAARRADKIRDRLDWEPGILNGEGLKPKRMHRKTFQRLRAIHNKFVNLSLKAASLKFGISFEL